MRYNTEGNKVSRYQCWPELTAHTMSMCLLMGQSVTHTHAHVGCVSDSSVMTTSACLLKPSPESECWVVCLLQEADGQ